MTGQGDGAATQTSRVSDTGAFDLFVGTYTESGGHVDGKAEGIYRVQIEARTGILALTRTFGDVLNPSWLTVHPSGRFLYAVHETSEFRGAAGGGVTAYLVKDDGDLDPVNGVSSYGEGPCHAAVDPLGGFLVVVHYGSGSLTVFPIHPDGSLGSPSDVVHHRGSSSHPVRQTGPHAHQAVFDRRGRLYVPDLGLNEILVYDLNTNGTLTRRTISELAEGAGPRHIAFHPSGRFAFTVNELDSTITTFAVSDSGLEIGPSISTIPSGWHGENSAAAIKVTADGRFVYGSNRGPDSIVTFAFDEAAGRLSFVSNQPTLGRTPRDFQFSPTGNLIIAANQDSDTLATFHVDIATGLLSPTGQLLELPTPVCLQLAPRPVVLTQSGNRLDPRTEL